MRRDLCSACSLTFQARRRRGRTKCNEIRLQEEVLTKFQVDELDALSLSLSLCPHTTLLSPVPTFIISARASKSNELVRTRRRRGVGPKWRVSSDISLHGRVAPMTCTLDRTRSSVRVVPLDGTSVL